jgi:hypothetical protein
MGFIIGSFTEQRESYGKTTRDNMCKYALGGVAIGSAFVIFADFIYPIPYQHYYGLE